MAFMYVSVTYYTIVKSSVPMWVLCFSVLLGLRLDPNALTLTLTP